MKQDPNIDELLNSFIDGELTVRQNTEVKRLAGNDAQIAKRLRELQKCKILVGTLPRAEAPAGMVEEVKNSLETRTLLGRQTEPFRIRAGAWHLFARKVLTNAAMIALMAVLALVVYTIVAPSSAPYKPVALDKPLIPKETPIDNLKPIMVAVEKPIVKTRRLGNEFNGRLELKTGNLVAVDAFINSAIEDIGLSKKVIKKDEGQRSIYTLSCGREALSLFLTDLGNIWDRFDSAVFTIQTDRFGERIAVDVVTAEQITKIVSQDNLKNSIQVAKDLAVLNDITERLPGKLILSAIEDTKDNLKAIPKPRLTSGEKAIKEPTSRDEDEQKVYITIVVEGSK